MELLILILGIPILCRELRDCLGIIGAVLLLALFCLISFISLILSMISLSLTKKIGDVITVLLRFVVFVIVFLGSPDRKPWHLSMQLGYHIVTHPDGVKESTILAAISMEVNPYSEYIIHYSIVFQFRKSLPIGNSSNCTWFPLCNCNRINTTSVGSSFQLRIECFCCYILCVLVKKSSIIYSIVCFD